MTTTSGQKRLSLRFHGRVLDHLGIQMYQSPVAAIAELISNSWDADAENVHVNLPTSLEPDSIIEIKDDGLGMTFEECQQKYLNVGWNRRGNNPAALSLKYHRPILGRKGIGKFAGFGIADLIQIDTISENTGERTIFQLDVNELRDGDYVAATEKEISVLEYLGPDNDRKREHGTKLTLKNLKMMRRPSPGQFTESMARRFLLHRYAQNFKVFINDVLLPEDDDNSHVEFSFPRAYEEEEKPQELIVDEEGWGSETLSNGKTIKWKIVFYREPIDHEELRGVAVYSRGKLSQTPFFFNLTGGLGGQHGQEYLSGQLEADYLDDTVQF